jgi:hypothetical protein
MCGSGISGERLHVAKRRNRGAPARLWQCQARTVHRHLSLRRHTRRPFSTHLSQPKHLHRRAPHLASFGSTRIALRRYRCIARVKASRCALRRHRRSESLYSRKCETSETYCETSETYCEAQSALVSSCSLQRPLKPLQTPVRQWGYL